jgi:hypothetical protein
VPFEIGDLPTQREIELFMAYKENRILDSEGDLGINNQRIHANRKLLNINNKAMCALYVARFPLNMAHF